MGVSTDIELYVDSTVNRAKEELLALVSARVATQLEDLIREAIQSALDDVVPEMVAHAVKAALDEHVADNHYWKSQDGNDPFRWAEAQQKAKIEVEKYRKR